MSANNLKKNLVFSSEEVKDLIDKMVSDEFLVGKRKPSAVLESLILNGLTTTNSQVSFWIKCVYSDKYSVMEIVSMVFKFNSVGTCGKSNHLPLLKFVKYVDYLEIINRSNDYCVSELENILDELENLKSFCETKQKENPSLEKEYNAVLISLDAIKNDLKKEKPIIRIRDFYLLVIKYWNYLEESTYTFRTLSHYCLLHKNLEITPDLRYELVSLLRDLAKNWNEDL